MRYLRNFNFMASLFASIVTICSFYLAPASAPPVPPVVNITVIGTVNAPISVLVAPR